MSQSLVECHDNLKNLGANMIQSKRYNPDEYINETELGVSQTDQPIQQEALNTVLSIFLAAKPNTHGDFILKDPH